MHNIEHLIPDIRADAEKSKPLESCGLIINFKGKLKYIACSNIYPGLNNFIIKPEDYAAAEDKGDIMYVVHSHVTQPPVFSTIDKVSLNKGTVPWVVYSLLTDTISIAEPTFTVEDYIGREYIYSVQDCFTIIQDYFKKEHNISMPDPCIRDPMDPLKGAGLYRRFLEYGFEEVPMSALKPSDCLIICNSSSEPNHAAIYLGDNVILHHAAGRLSCREILGHFWIKNTWKCVRHSSLNNDNS